MKMLVTVQLCSISERIWCAIADLVYFNDKNRFKIGEPGMPFATVERGRQIIVTIWQEI